MARQSNSVVVIDGEASESDDDVSTPDAGKACRGIAVEGEAPESDDEIVSFSKESPSTGIEARESSWPKQNSIISSESYLGSILQKKLFDRNVSLWQNLNNLVKDTSIFASKQLIATDQQLLKTQGTLQSTGVSVKKFNDLNAQIVTKYKDILACNFIPDIKMNK